jgi:hypothetical protein
VSPEWVSATAAVATLVVIVASAFAAVTQLRHMRSANHVAAMLELRETLTSRAFSESYVAAIRFLSDNLAQPDVRRTILTAERLSTLPEFEPVRSVGNFFENAGCLVKNEAIDAAIFCDLLSEVVVSTWKAYAPFVAHRRLRTGNALYENFEYIAVLSEDWISACPNGAYPRGKRRMELRETWPEATALAGDARTVDESVNAR